MNNKAAKIFLSCGNNVIARVAICLLASGVSAGHTFPSVSVRSGTAVVALHSHGVLLAGVDSQENYLVYRNGSFSLDRRTVCKVAQPGPYFAVVAGITQGSNGFDAVVDAGQSWQPGDDLSTVATRIRTSIPGRLRVLLESLRDADRTAFSARYLNRVATQILLTGTEHGSPRLRILEFFETGMNPVEIEVRERGCPEECGNSPAAWFLGTHDSIDDYLRLNSRAAARADESTLNRLIGLEYEARPDVVGGPLSVIRVGRNGAELVRAGACIPAVAVSAASGRMQ